MTMIDAVYRVVEHDGGWAYTLDGSYSETFPTQRAATDAAREAVRTQQSPGEDEAISWQDEAGRWHDEMEPGSNRPHAMLASDRGGWGEAPEPRRRSSARTVVDHVRGVYDHGDHYARKGMRAARRETRGQPLAAVLLAGLCGYGLAMLMLRRD